MESIECNVEDLLGIYRIRYGNSELRTDLHFYLTRKFIFGFTLKRRIPKKLRIIRAYGQAECFEMYY